MKARLIDTLARLLGMTVYIEGVRHGAKVREGARDSMSADSSPASR
jgi:hypothetical protein